MLTTDVVTAGCKDFYEDMTKTSLQKCHGEKWSVELDAANEWLEKQWPGLDELNVLSCFTDQLVVIPRLLL